MQTKVAIKGLTGQRLLEMFHLMLDRFGPQNWWPADTEFEMMVGAILTQNTSWKNVVKAIENLKKKNLLTLQGLKSLPVSDLAAEIRPAGYFNIKARRLRNLIDFIANQYQADLSLFFSEKTDTLREGLLSVKGIGPETADSILLYVAHRPVFVVDTYTYRILFRHGMMEEQASYYDLQELFMDNLPDDPSLFNEFHALIVRTGKEYCRKNPLCDLCPLADLGSTIPSRAFFHE